jgi:hypothetical protein
MIPNMIGAYGEWAAQTMQDPARLSFRQPMFSDVEAWRAVARARYRELLMGPGGAATPVATVEHRLEFDGLSIEHLRLATAVRTADGGACAEAVRRHREVAWYCGPA